MVQNDELVLLSGKKKNNNHIYKDTLTNKQYPSITTILSSDESKQQSLQKWRDSEPAHQYIVKIAQGIGIQTHCIIADYFNDCLVTDKFDLVPVAHFNNLMPFLQKVSNVVNVECMMKSDTMNVAGTADLIADYDGKLSIIDYKTKRKAQTEEYMFDYYLQTSCYAAMFKERTGKQIQQVVILVSSEKNTRQEFIKNPNNYYRSFMDRINTYYKSHEIK